MVAFFMDRKVKNREGSLNEVVGMVNIVQKKFSSGKFEVRNRDPSG